MFAVVLAAFPFGAISANAEGNTGEKPRVFALVSAMGDVFTATRETMHTGSHLPPWRRTSIDAKDNILDKLVLAGLDEAVRKMEPSSKRSYYAIPIRRGPTETTHMDEAARDAALADLKDMSERSSWDRIVIATPGYSTHSIDAMPERTQGFGIFMNPLCQSLSGSCGMSDLGTDLGNDHLGDGIKGSGGETAKTPDSKIVKANQYVAAYVDLKIWIVDPATLEVIDSQEIFEYQKMANPTSDSLDLSQIIPKRELATQIVKLSAKATQEAVQRSELRGQVEVKEKGPVAPAR